MKRKLYATPLRKSNNRTKARTRLALLLVAALAVACAAVSTASLAQTKKKQARTEPRPETLLRGDTLRQEVRESEVAPPKRKSAERPSAGKGARRTRQQQEDGNLGERRGRANGRNERAEGRPSEHKLRRGRAFDGDLRQLPQTRPEQTERPEPEGPEPSPSMIEPPGGGKAVAEGAQAPEGPNVPAAAAAAPAPTSNFDGLDVAGGWAAGYPPDTVGDVGPTYYIQSINSSVGIYRKSDGFRLTAFSLNTLMSQGHQGNLCDTNNNGDPVVLYDTFEDRWIITDFAFQSSGGNVVNPPGSFQCFAVSKSGDPLTGGWNFYSINTAGGFGDYPKFGIWPDGLYMSASMFTYVGSSYIGPRMYAFNKAQMYAGAPTVQSVSFDGPSADFTVIPSNARLQTGTPPPGTPNYYVSTWRFLNAVSVYKFHVDWNHPSLSTLTGPDTPATATSWPNASVANAPSLGGLSAGLDVLQIRAMMQNQYTNLGGVESLWAIHTVRRGDTSGFAAPRFYQVPVTGGTVGANATQAATFDPDGANVMHRFMPSLAVNRNGDMAFGYSTSSSTTKPAIKYAGRLAADPINTFSQTEQTLIQGTGTQNNNCGGAPCARWGDYAAMSLDPDGCTFWFTSEYYAADGGSYKTRIGSFNLPQCTPFVSGSVQGNVTSTAGGGPVAGATVALGTRTTTTDAAGFYSFSNIPAGTYPVITASFPGYTSASQASLVVGEGSVTVKNFALSPAADSSCLTDTTAADFQAGVPTNVDLATSPGDVTLLNPNAPDQQNISLGTSGFNVTTTQWLGQTFAPAVSGPLKKVDINLFCATNCTGANPPPVTIDIRTTSGGLPTNTILASATVAGFNSGSAAFYTATFSTPPALTANTTYAIMTRLATSRAAAGATGNYNATFSTANPYSRGTLVFTTTGGAPFSSIAADDLGFRAYIDTGYASSGTLVSGLKDANPHAGGSTSWTTLSWNASTPAGTAVKFQVAASTSPFGPFTFVGPDGTAATFYTTSGGSLAQFNGKRYLKYTATLTTSNGAVTPVLNDVTACFGNSVPTALSVGSATGTYGGTVNLSATLTDGVSPLSGKTVSFTLNGNSVGSAVTDASGVAALSGASLAGINAGSYPAGVGASFPAAAPYLASSATGALTVNRASQSITFGALADKTYGDAPFQVSATGGGSGNPVTFAAAGNCTSGGTNGATITITGAGSCTVTASQADNTNYDAAADVPQAFTVNKANATVVVNGYNGTYDGAAHPATGFAYGVGGASDVLAPAVTFTYNGNAAQPVSAAVYNVVASFAGNANYNPASNTTTVTINKATPTITWNDPADIVYGTALSNAQLNATASVPGSFTYIPAAGAVLNAGSGQTLHVDFMPTDTTNYTGASKDAVINVTKAGQTITFGALADKTYGDAPFTVNATGGDSGNPVTFAAVGNCTSGGTNGATITITGAGACTVTASQAGNSNYDAAADVAQPFNVNKANAHVSVSGYSGVYDGAAHGATGTATGAKGEDLSSLLDLGASYTNVPGGTAHWTFPGDANHNPSSGDVQIVITQATPGITWANPADIVYGTALGAAQLNASHSVAGSFVYTPAAGAVLGAGAHTLHVDFTPTDTVNYTGASKDVSINVLKAVLTITADNKSKTYGDANPALTYTPSGFVNGDTPATSYAGAPALSTVAANSGAGTYPINAAAGTLTSANYSFNFVAGTLTVDKAALTVKADDKSRLVGAPNPAFTASYSGFVLGEGPGVLGGVLTFATPATPASPAGAYPITPSGLTSANYNITFVNGTLYVGFNVCVDYDQTKANKSGSTVPVKFRLCDASGGNLSSAATAVHAVSVVNAATSAAQPVQDAGNANPGNYFRFDSGGYIFNLKTTGYPAGTYNLGFTVAGDPTTHAVQFVVRN